MINPEKQRIEAKLKLWETPGFFQFIDDLSKYTGEIIDLKTSIEAVRRNYVARIKDIDENDNTKLKQGKLPL